MPDFQYRAVDSTGQQQKGVLSAMDEMHLDAQLKEIGCWLIESQKVKLSKKRVKVSVTRPELIEFCISMAALLGSGVSIVDALNTCTEETTNEGFVQILKEISEDIRSGNTFASCLQKYPKVFPKQMCNLINAAEYSGNLIDAFKDISEYLQWTDHLVKDLKQVSLYPTIVLTVVGAFILLLFSFVVPKFTELLNSVNVALPLITQIVVAISDFTKQYWYLIIATPIVCFKSLKFAIERSEAFATFVDERLLKFPIFGEVILMLCLSRFTHNMAILIRSGVPILQSLELCRDLVGNRVISKAIVEAEDAVNRGQTMSEVFRHHAVFPPTLLRMIIVGEETGTLEKSLNHISERYDDEIPRRIKKVMGIFEPALMVFLIAIVGAVVMSIFMPLMALMGSVG